MSVNLEGALVLVGAGIFGKIYCDVARNHGAVALDIGSAFDLMVGLMTRPVHDWIVTKQWFLECEKKGIVQKLFRGS